ncbi:hypothetical protein [Bacillus testis]|uniref:hypothetical protein n=1 Tax=Bacillus testis TaxID=1622072 RepID=UPI00067EBBBD|nr:hypothetical protein [Bacillus testis]
MKVFLNKGQTAVKSLTDQKMKLYEEIKISQQHTELFLRRYLQYKKKLQFIMGKEDVEDERLLLLKKQYEQSAFETGELVERNTLLIEAVQKQIVDGMALYSHTQKKPLSEYLTRLTSPIFNGD